MCQILVNAFSERHSLQVAFRSNNLTSRAFREKPTVPGGLTYEAAGVSIEAGNSLVQRIKPLVKATQRPGADGEIGGFGGLFDLKAAGYQDPVLVAGIDGIGTKVKVAQAMNKYDTIGSHQMMTADDRR